MFDDKNPAFTPISHLGEFGLIKHLTEKFPLFHSQTLKSVGDDAAVVRCEKDKLQVLSTDLLLEGVHFDLSYVPLRHLGYKAVVVNLSDIFAMNAKPYGITVSIGLSSRFTLEAAEELYEGVKLACEKYKVELLGGDTSSSKQGLIISVTAMGFADEKDICYRNGAKANDLICVTGDLGAAYAGFLVLNREKVTYLANPDMQPDLSEYDYVMGRQLKPENHPAVLEELAKRGVKPTSMIDISDGLASELHHICLQSNCGATVYADKLPIDWQTSKVAEEFNISPTTFAMNGGEDYELLMTIDIADFNKIKDVGDITIIGHITPEARDINIVINPTEMIKVEAQGWNHFQ